VDVASVAASAFLGLRKAKELALAFRTETTVVALAAVVNDPMCIAFTPSDSNSDSREWIYSTTCRMCSVVFGNTIAGASISIEKGLIACHR
tara:strand:- start:14079 stop:14351 length:273 start_codon:yes stop_codon:yes gene_type:complete